MVNQEILDDLQLVRDIIDTSDVSVVAAKNGQVLSKKKGEGIKPFLEIIGELGDNIHGSIIGDRILGKASSLLCRYSKVRAVYSPQATKTAIAFLIIDGIPSQIDQLIPFIKNRDGSGLCIFEKMLENISSPEEAYKLLKGKVMKKS